MYTFGIGYRTPHIQDVLTGHLLVPPAFVLLPLFGISCPIYWNGPLYQKVFRKVADLQEAD